MSRTFEPISLDDFKVKFQEMVDAEDNFPHTLPDKFGQDLKIKFDFENCEYQPCSYLKGNDEKFMGFHVTEDGLAFCGMCAGGDWETPVNFIIYWNGKKLRAYVPTNGNVFNTDTKEAYGNDDEADLTNAKKCYSDLDWSQVEYFSDSDIPDCDYDKMLADIKARIVKKA